MSAMKQAGGMNDRRSFLRKFGLGLGAITIGPEQAAAFFYQKKSMSRRPAPPAEPQNVDFRFAPGDWSSPVRYPGGTGQSFIGRSGGLARSPGAGSVGVFIDGAGEVTSLAQSCEAPHVPILRTTISYGDAKIEMTAFSSARGDEVEADTITILPIPAAAALTVRLLVRSDRPLEARIEEDDDLPRGGFCVVAPEGEGDRPFLVLDARPGVGREGDALVLTIPVAPGERTAAEPIHLRIPRGEGDAGDLLSGIRRLEERAAVERDRWSAWKTQRGPAGWDLPGVYGEFAVAGARIIDQMTAPAPAEAPAGGVHRPGARGVHSAVGPLPDLVDEHFLTEAELFLGREKEARARLLSVWGLEQPGGILVGAGGELNTKEQCAAVYSLCRYAELTGDWALFDELYPDAFNALEHLMQKREAAAAQPAGDPNAAAKLLPAGSPGPGWPGAWAEMTNTLWALFTLNLLLEISDRRFLMKKSQTRDYYRELRIAYVNATRATMKPDPAGFSWYPMVTAPLSGDAPAGVPLPQACLGTLALGLYPGVLFKREDAQARDFPALVKSSLRNGAPAGTGYGPADAMLPVDGLLAAQTMTWFMMPEEARSLFIGCLNHASPVYTWNRAGSGGPGEGGAGAPVDLRASAECIRFLRHAMVMEDGDLLRLFEGIGKEDLSPGRRLAIDRTPTRWGRVSVSLDPVDARTWKVTFSREPGDQAKALPLKAVEMPRVLGPNFRFDTITPGTAIKNGPRVIVDADKLNWEAHLRDLRRY